ncbi:MAG TPA: hypothetical protein V6C72_12725 [Chroococcales cyanobacterium]
MNARTKVFIVDRDCASLVSLMLWLDQFADLEVTGATADATSMAGALVGQVKRAQPDVVLVDLASAIEIADTTVFPTTLVKAIKSAAGEPGILIRGQHDQEIALAAETDGYFGPKSSIKELADAIRKIANKRRLALSAANMPMTKAG